MSIHTSPDYTFLTFPDIKNSQENKEHSQREDKENLRAYNFAM